MTVSEETSTETSPQDLAELRSRKAAAFQMAMGPVTVVAVLTWLGLQAILPFTDPAILDVTLTSLGIYYLTEYDKRVFDRTTAGNRLAGRISFTMFAACAFLQLANIAIISSEIEKPCERLRTSFIANPDSNVSDAYEALHCPLTIESRVKRILRGLTG